MHKLTIGVASVVAAMLIPITSADGAPSVRMTKVQYDSPGADNSTNSSLNAEWVRITNFASTKKVLTGWTLRDNQNHIYKFPTFTLNRGASVRVHTGRGVNTATDLHWRSDTYVWNNTGDRAALKNKAGILVDACRWGNGSGSTTCQ